MPDEDLLHVMLSLSMVNGMGEETFEHRGGNEVPADVILLP